MICSVPNISGAAKGIKMKEICIFSGKATLLSPQDVFLEGYIRLSFLFNFLNK